jgi:hypothetical protein
MKLLFWASTAVTVGLAIYLILVAGPYLAAQANGLAPFDLRRSGYSSFEAKQFLDALSPEGAAFYLKVWWPLDTVFLLSLAIFAGLSIRSLYAGGAGMWGSAAKILPVGYVIFDFLENRKVAQMIRDGADALKEATVLSASLMTVMKFVVFYIIVALLLGGLLYRYRAGKSAT